MSGVCFAVFMPLYLSLCFSSQNFVCSQLHMHMPTMPRL